MNSKECKEYFLNNVCNDCKANWYCPSDCAVKEKAKQLTDAQWEDLAKKYNDDIVAIWNSIKRRKVK